jgi:hypothetical protein
MQRAAAPVKPSHVIGAMRFRRSRSSAESALLRGLERAHRRIGGEQPVGDGAAEAEVPDAGLGIGAVDLRDVEAGDQLGILVPELACRPGTS